MFIFCERGICEERKCFSKLCSAATRKRFRGDPRSSGVAVLLNTQSIASVMTTLIFVGSLSASSSFSLFLTIFCEALGVQVSFANGNGHCLERSIVASSYAFPLTVKLHQLKLKRPFPLAFGLFVRGTSKSGKFRTGRDWLQLLRL